MDDYNYIFSEEQINSVKNVKGKITVVNTEKKDALLLTRFMELDNIFPKTIGKNTSLHIISSDNFGSIELLKVIAKRVRITELFITTWSYNDDFVKLMESLLSDNISISFFVDRSIKTRKAHLYAQMVTLRDKFHNFKIRVHFMLHSKVTLIKTADQFISLESSANYSKNTRIENFTLTENEDLFNFHKNWMLDLIGK
jgi:hypothetical protein